MMPKDRSVESFGRDTMAEHFDPNWWEKLSKEELAKENLFIVVEKKKYPASVILKPLNNKNIRSI